MAREPRITSEYIHLMWRGIGKQIIFEDNADYKFFLSKLKMYSNQTNVIILCYCLMDNHIHMLVYDREKHVSAFMCKLGTCYAHYFNDKYGRVGHLFQDRFKSQNVLSERQLITTFRYILNNPAKAGVARADRYRWSSYKEYGKRGGITDTTLIRKLIGSKSDLDLLLGKSEETDDMDYDTFHTYNRAIDIIHNQLQLSSGTQIKTFSKEKRNEMLKILRDYGFSFYEIERLTGIPKTIISRAVKE